MIIVARYSVALCLLLTVALLCLTGNTIIAADKKTSGATMIKQGSFNKADQNLWKIDGNVQIEEPVIKNGELVVKILENVYEQHMQSICYTQGLDIKKNTSYRLSFKARSSVACKHVRPVIDRPDAKWAKIFLGDSLKFTTKMKKYSIDFKTTDTDANSRLLFYTGLMEGDTGGGKHTLYFDKIQLVERVK